MSENPISQKITEAWKLHRTGFHEQAIDQFRNALNMEPDNIDALYGLGLAQKAAGLLEAARDSFEQVIHYAEQLQVATENQENRDERYFMVANMARQYLSRLKV
jgi:tetratricopeptide (TPR) repeat protein